MNRVCFLIAVIIFAVAFFADKDAIKWMTGGLAFVAAGLLLDGYGPAFFAGRRRSDG